MEKFEKLKEILKQEDLREITVWTLNKKIIGPKPYFHLNEYFSKLPVFYEIIN